VRVGSGGEGARAVLGIDTSYYTTSVAVLDERGGVLWEKRVPVPVERGRRGVRPSRALFEHVRRLPVLIEEACAVDGLPVPSTIAVSCRPRPDPDSYLPVFVAGTGYARALASAWGARLFETSHQEGHLACAPADALAGEAPFLCLHLSGGTTDLLLVQRTGGGRACSPRGPFRFERLGGSIDIHAGQLVDRVGVMLGLPFPAGPDLEELASRGAGGRADEGYDPDGQAPTLAVAVEGYDVSFAGPYTHAQRLFHAGVPGEEVAAATLRCVSLSAVRMTRRALKETEARRVVVVGGVAACSHVRSAVRAALERLEIGAQAFFPPRELCTDNAVGVARAALLAAGAPAGGN